MGDQEFATRHEDGQSLLRVVLEYFGLNTGECLGFRVMIENRRTGDEVFVRSFLLATKYDKQSTYSEANSFCHKLAGTMECDYQDKARAYLGKV